MSYAVDPGQLQAFLAAERAQESSGNYAANNPGGASGAYQFEPATWREWATKAGFPQYAGKPAADAPPAVQDAAASAMASSYYSSSGSWLVTAEDWYYPAGVAHPSIVPPGNVLSVGQYGADVMARMGANPSSSPNSAGPVQAQTASIAGDLAGPIIGWVDNYAIRAALFLAGAVAIIAGLVHLVRPSDHGTAGAAAPPQPAQAARKPAGEGNRGSPASSSGSEAESGAAADIEATL